MASSFSRSSKALPYIAGIAVVGTAGVYHANRRPIMLDSAQNAPTKLLKPPSGMLFSKELTVKKSEQINHDTKRITFALPRGSNEVTGVPAGAAILTQTYPGGRFLPVLRPYTPVSDPDERGSLELVVKQYPGGRASTHLHSLKEGEKLLIRGPIPGYSWVTSNQQPKEPRTVLMIAGGAGITPIYSLTKGILSNANDQTRVHLFWGVNGTRDIVLKDELDSLEQKYPGRLQVTYCVSGPEGQSEATSLGDDQKYKKGYVSKAVLEEAISRLDQKNWGDEKGTKVWLCGPPAMEKSLAGKKGILAELGVESKKVHKF